MNCTNMGCPDSAVALVPGYPEPLPKCFTHEREYVDRYDHWGVTPLDRCDVSVAVTAGGGATQTMQCRHRGEHSDHEYDEEEL